jgi:hypothetical protein
MTHTLAGFLSSQSADAAHVEQAARYVVAEWSEDLPPESMREQMIISGASSRAVDELLNRLQNDSDALEAAALTVLSYSWDEVALRQSTQGAIVEAKSKLPVIEAGIIATAIMYGLWLVATKGKRTHVKIVRRAPDGSYEEIEATEWWDAAGPLRAVADLVGGSPQASEQTGPEVGSTDFLNEG